MHTKEHLRAVNEIEGSMDTVYLFYDGFELRAVEGRFAKFYEYLRGQARRVWRTMKRQQVYTGFYVAFDNLVRSLKAAGHTVRINDYKGARKNATIPIGIAGYPTVLPKIASLKNPKLFGPGDPGLPLETEQAAGALSLKRIIQPCQWFVDVYSPWCGERMVVWPTGIDLGALKPRDPNSIEFDMLIYDKIRWNRNEVFNNVIQPLVRLLDGRGLSYKVIRYGAHTQAHFLSLVKRSRSFAFICEHETQGLACQEVMAMDVPIFAWDEGALCDPILKKFVPPDFKVSSVPYWDERCGIRFKTKYLEENFNKFITRLDTFRPREFVSAELGLELAAQRYLSILSSLA